MVEVYFNAQSNNGTLTDGESIRLAMNQGCRNDTSDLRHNCSHLKQSCGR